MVIDEIDTCFIRVELLLGTDVRLDLVGFDMNHKHSFPVILEYSNIEPWTWSTYLQEIRGSIKGIIQSVLPLNDGCNTETPVRRDLRLRLALKTLK